ncbi:MAG: hypothetical protein QOH73_69 [Gaiellaceae bacterium]|jgi:hypothetical protein|nr:hypothetical protein [Gaiellaceae bacterium]
MRRERAQLAPLRRQLPIEPGAIRAARRLLLAVAAVVVAVDIGDKLVTPTLPEAFHPRPPIVLLAMVVVTVLGLVTFPRAGSRAIAIAGGLMVGGGVANTVSLLAWGSGIPNPLLSSRYDIAFNLADLAVGSGFVLLLPATLAFAVRHREHLNSPL